MQLLQETRMHQLEKEVKKNIQENTDQERKMKGKNEREKQWNFAKDRYW